MTKKRLLVAIFAIEGMLMLLDAVLIWQDHVDPRRGLV